MRLRNDPSAKEYILNSNMIINSFPVEINENTILEIGMGKGEMLTQLALENPNKIFIGIEKYPTVVVKALKRAETLKLNNFFVINKDLKELTHSFKGTVDEIWLTFSDPWPKDRHYKRRLTYKDFLTIYKKLLSNKGILKIKTDNDKFFDWSINSIKEFGANIIYLTNDLHNSKRNSSNIKTGYELKWSEKGQTINYMEIIF